MAVLAGMPSTKNATQKIAAVKATSIPKAKAASSRPAPQEQRQQQQAAPTRKAGIPKSEREVLKERTEQLAEAKVRVRLDFWPLIPVHPRAT